MQLAWKEVHRSSAIRRLIEAYRALLDAESASILLIDGEVMRFCIVEGLNAAALEGTGDAEFAFSIKLSEDRGINSIAALMGKTLCMQQMDGRHNTDVDEQLNQRTRSILVVPLIVDQSVVGTLSAINPHSQLQEPLRYRFTSEDTAAAESSAAGIAAILAGISGLERP
ncbi:MAG: GAF domain-containing protein [Candidatus Sumerlaeota bacterium]